MSTTNDLSASSPSLSKDQQQNGQKSPEEWENTAFSRILQVSLDEMSSAQDASLVFLNHLSKELKDEKVEFEKTGNVASEVFYHPASTKPLITTSLLDRVLVARLSLPENVDREKESLFLYLLIAWKRCMDVKKKLSIHLKDEDVLSKRLAALEKARELIISYVGIVLQMPDMFPQPQKFQDIGSGQLLEHLLIFDDSNPKYIPDDFFEQLIGRFQDEGLEDIVRGLAMTLVSEMRKINILQKWMPLFQVFSRLIGFKAITETLVKLPVFCTPGLPPRAFEVATLLGPFFRTSIFPEDDPSVVKSIFPNPLDTSPIDLPAGFSSLRQSLNLVQNNLYQLVMSLIKSSPEIRENVLQYFAQVIKINEKRSRMQIDRQQVSGDGFMFNLGLVALKLCDPFSNPPYAKIGMIDLDYFKVSKRIDIEKATKMHADQEASDRYYKQNELVNQTYSPPHFISESFYITLSILHLGLTRGFVEYSNLQRDLTDLQKQLEVLKAQRSSWAGTPSQAMNEHYLRRAQAQAELMGSRKLCYETQLLDQNVLQQVLRFYNLSSVYLIRKILAPHGIEYPSSNHQEAMKNFPLPSDPEKNIHFMMIPEWILEDINEFWLFLMRHDPNVLLLGGVGPNVFDDYLAMAMVVLQHTQLVKNPYLKSKLVEVLFVVSYSFPRGFTGSYGVFDTHPLARDYLISSIMSLWVEVEQTGMSSQFYDKFNIRYNISQILQRVWTNPWYKEKIKAESKKTTTFVKFVNLLINDTTYLLDESISKLSEIHAIQTEMDQTSTWEQQTEEYRKEKESSLRNYERQATSYVSLGNETVHMLQYMTAEIVDPFLTPEIIDRFAAMLDYNLNMLVGPKCTELKVKNPEKYRFQPKNLLSELIDIYLHLSHRQEFVLAVARDGRSYRKEWFQKAAGAMLKTGMKSAGDIDEMAKFVDKVEQAIQQDQVEEEELGDIPDEFLDPLMCTLMEDPVILPTSSVTVDLSTIKSHLLSDKFDPFNRQMLTIEQVVPNTELKKKIEEFKAQAKKNKSK